MVRVGKIVATHGLNGAVIFTHIVGSSKWLKKEVPLLVEMQKNSYIPYFISQFKASNEKEYIINIEEIDKIDQAKKLVSKHVYIDELYIESYSKQSPLLWIGYTIKDRGKGAIGVVEDVLQTGNQWLAKVTYKNAEVLIPLIDQMIVKVHTKTRIIEMNLPEGLLEIYL